MGTDTAPARPGAALLTATAGAPLLPIGLTGFPRIFSSSGKANEPG
jgi:1-acyl-sn-glycerol-3-phosphate acyltransferase